MLNSSDYTSVIVDFLHYNSCELSPIATGSSTVEQVSSFKLLGVFVSEDLLWNVHYDYILKKTYKQLNLRQLEMYCGPALHKPAIALAAGLLRIHD